MMNRLIDHMLKTDRAAPFVDRPVLSVGVLSVVLSLTGTILIYA